MLERRKYIRLGELVKIDYKIIGLETNQPGCLADNICGGGIRLALKERLSPGTKLDLKIQLPNEKELVRATGEIIWLDVKKPGTKGFPFLAGIKFTEIDPFECGKILKFVGNKIQNKEPSDSKTQNTDIRWMD